MWSLVLVIHQNMLVGISGRGVAQHLPQQRPVEAGDADVAVEPRGEKEEQRGAEIRRRGGQHIARDAPLEARDEEHDKKQVEHGVEHAVHRVEPGVLFGPHKLAAQVAQNAHHHIGIEQRGVAAHVRDARHQRPAGREDGDAHPLGDEAAGEHRGLVVGLVQAVADHRVGDAHRDDGQQQLGVLGDQVRVAELAQAEHPGEKRHEQKGKDLARKRADRKEHRVRHQPFVFVQKITSVPAGEGPSPLY